MATQIITAPSPEVVTLAEAKAYMRVDFDDDDLLIEALITAAREQAEHRTNGRAFGAQVRELVLDDFPAGEIRLDGTPVTSITSVSYADSNGDTVVMDAADYVLDEASVPSWLFPATGTAWPATHGSANDVRIRYACGHTAVQVASVRQWILLATGTLYCSREATSDRAINELPRGFVDGLLDPWVIY